ncbi:hypothetical protein ACFQ0Q_04340 [Streptomyces aureus]
MPWTCAIRPMVASSPVSTAAGHACWSSSLAPYGSPYAVSQAARHRPRAIRRVSERHIGSSRSRWRRPSSAAS